MRPDSPMAVIGFARSVMRSSGRVQILWAEGWEKLRRGSGEGDRTTESQGHGGEHGRALTAGSQSISNPPIAALRCATQKPFVVLESTDNAVRCDSTIAH